MARAAPLIEHLFRRAAFGLAPADRGRFVSGGQSYRQVVDSLLVYDERAEIDHLIGTPGYVGLTTSGPLTPNVDIQEARQRWLFRMVHSPSPLRERMALFWHHHFATAYSKIAGLFGPADAARLMAAMPLEDPTRQRGQIELFRQYALGNFSDLLVEVARDPAMLIWLDGYLNTRARPQENFARELMELFTIGVGHFTEEDVYAAARVFTGWNLRRSGSGGAGTRAYRFMFDPQEHEATAKTFTFPVYLGRGTDEAFRMPARAPQNGMQDGLDLIRALAFHPQTARRLAGRLWTWFVSETEEPTERFLSSIARVYLDQGTNMRAVVRAVLTSDEFRDPKRFYQRYAWPVEFVVRLLHEVGHIGFSLGSALTPLVNMGQQLYEPPDVNGWELGQGWFTTGAMLARMNFASQLATNQRVALRDAARPFNAQPERLVDFVYDRLTVPFVADDYDAVLTYVRAGGLWTGSDGQLLTKAAGACHLVAGSGEYQFV